MDGKTYEPAEIQQEELYLVRRLIVALVGGLFIINAFIARYMFPQTPQISGLSALAGALILSIPMVIEAMRGFYTGNLALTELASVAVLACIATGDYRTAGVVAFILILGHLLTNRTALGAREAIESLLKLTPNIAHRLEGEAERDVPVGDLKPGDIIRVKPGENIPADGIIQKGDTTVNQASITGESLPVDKTPEDEVYQGTSNITGVIALKVTKVGEDTTLGKVKHLILQAEKTRIPIVTIMERYIHWYIPVILMISGLILFFTRDANRAISALIVGVPCALILATPTAIIAVLSAAARSGVMIKETDKIEVAADIDSVVFDKTGTLTTGELKVTSLNPEGGITPERFLYFVASMEKHSLHPVSRAVKDLAREAKVKTGEPEEFREAGGKGVKGKVDGKSVIVGRKTWLVENGVDVPEIDIETGSILYVSVDGKYLGYLGLEDQMRLEALETTDKLKKMGIHKIVMLTGDKKEVAEKIARESGFEEVMAECLPEYKMEIVEELRKKGHRVVVVGDGINDAPALTAGDIGMAMGAMGSDVAINSASVALMTNDLTKVPFFLAISRMANRVIYQNIVFGGAFVLLGLVLAGMGIVNPVIAALYHEIGSLFVIFNSARIVKFE
jgi:Zn2+/Cd2+-exporting ATPase